jgi:hypothetical protein
MLLYYASFFLGIVLYHGACIVTIHPNIKICNIPDIKSMQNINKMLEMVDEQQYNQNNTTIIPK